VPTKIAEPRRAEREVNGKRNDWKPDQRDDGSRAARPDVRRDGRSAPTVGRGQQAAADFDARGRRLGSADQSGGNIAIDLGKLILVDHRLAAAALRWPNATQRPEHGENRRRRHQREHKPQRHQAGSGWAAPTEGRRHAALHQRRQARQSTIVRFRLRQTTPEHPLKVRRQPI